MAIIPTVPENIIVHLGSPDSNAQNVSVPFIDYIKNVASSEIYPTWGEQALRANILAQISFALNRIYTEFYRAQGKNFDITDSTAIDQKFIYGRNTFANVDRIVDDIFNDYIRRIGTTEPLAAKFCNGTTVTCNGLSQWGSEYLDQQGLGYFDILKNYYGDDIEIVVNAPIADVEESYPGYSISIGDTGRNVERIQTMLNRISNDYPIIPKVAADGIFGPATQNAVRIFQRTFNLTQDGIVGRATWYKMIRLYTGLKRFSELNSEGQRFFTYNWDYRVATSSISSQNVKVAVNGDEQITIGDTGSEVLVIQYFLRVIAEYYPFVTARVYVDGTFNENDAEAVMSIQKAYSLPETGVVDETTWNSIYNMIEGILYAQISMSSIAIPTPRPYTRDLSEGDRGEDVKDVQGYLNFYNFVSRNDQIIDADGIFGPNTKRAVEQFQLRAGLPVTGVVDRKTYDTLVIAFIDALSALITRATQFPGYDLELGDVDNVGV